LAKAHSEGDLITRKMKDLREKHLQRVQTRQVSPLKSLIFVDILQSYRKIKDHALNVAEAVAGEK
jgi:phosphate:Na+ symporter